MHTSHNAASEPQKKRKCKVWLNTWAERIDSKHGHICSGSVVKATLSDVVNIIVTLMGFSGCIYDKELGCGLESKCPKVFLPLQNCSTVYDVKVSSKIILLYTVATVLYVKQYSI